MHPFRSAIAATMAACALIAAAPATAQEQFPNRPLRIIVPAASGGPTDAVSRLIAEKMAANLGQPVIVEAKPGAGGNLGAEYVARSAPDGYTILMGTIGTHAVNKTLYKKLSFDPVKDFVAISQVVSYPLIVVANPKLQANNIRELIDYARQRPGTLNRASGGTGTSMHLFGELFNDMAGVRMTHIPYKGSAPALQDLVGGQVDLAFDSMIVALPLVKAGKLKALAVTSKERSPIVPDVPAISETLPGYGFTSWIGLYAPAGTPKPVAERISAAVSAALSNPEVRERLTAQAAMPVGSSVDEFTAFTQAEVERWGKVVRASGATAD